MTREATARTDRPSADPHPGGPAVHVLVVAYGAARLLDTCLGELDGAYPVLVVDNSSDPDVRAVAERHGCRYVDPGHNLGFAGGVNVGLGQLDPLDGTSSSSTRTRQSPRPAWRPSARASTPTPAWPAWPRPRSTATVGIACQRP